MEGFIKLPRSLLEWEWFDDPNTLKLYINLLFMAEYCDKSYKGCLLKRGQYLTTVAKLSEKCGLSVRQTRTVLEHLETTNKVTIKSTNKFSVITLLEYDCDTENDKQNCKPTINERQKTRQSNDKPTLLISQFGCVLLMS